MSEPALRIGFIGAGRAGTALAMGLAAASYEVVAVASRSPDSAQALAAQLPGAVAQESPQAVVDGCDLVFITTPDDAIGAVAKALVWRQGIGVVHTSGGESRDVLEPAAAAGAETGSLHPLQTFAGRDANVPDFRGVTFAVEAEGRLHGWLLAIVSALGGETIQLSAADKALYHAGAVLVSNYVVTLTKLATDLWLRFGCERPQALRALLPLLGGTVANLKDLGVPAALTGPVARGDVATVRRHLDALADTTLLGAYRALAIETIPVALAKGDLDESAAAELRRLLAGQSAGVLEGRRGSA